MNTQEQISQEEIERKKIVETIFKPLFSTTCIDNNEALEKCTNLYSENIDLFEKTLLKNQITGVSQLDEFIGRDIVGYLESMVEYTGVKQLMSDNIMEVSNLIKQFICKSIQMKTYNDDSFEHLFENLIYGYVGELSTAEFLKKNQYTIIEDNNYILPKASYDIRVKKDAVIETKTGIKELKTLVYDIEVKTYPVDQLRLDDNYSDKQGTKYVRLHRNLNSRNKWDMLFVNSFEKEKGIQPIYMVVHPKIEKDYDASGLMLPSKKEYDFGWWVAESNRVFVCDNGIVPYNFKKITSKLDYNHKKEKPSLTK